jgi:hypothetical protein
MLAGERIVGVIPTARIKTGLFSKKIYTLVVTDRRLILAEMTNDALKGAIEEARAARKAAGGGFFGQWKAQLEASISFANRYFSMPPEVIITETLGNLAFGPGDVKRIKVERKTERNNDEDHIGVDRDFLRITIEAQGIKREFNTDGENPSVDAARGLLAAIFGPAVR